jgi:hypothetical protein
MRVGKLNKVEGVIFILRKPRSCAGRRTGDEDGDAHSGKFEKIASIHKIGHV